MRQLMIVLAICFFLSGAPDSFAQSPTPEPERDKNEIYLAVEGAVQDVELRLPNAQDFTYNPAKHSLGGRFEYVRKVTPLLGIGARAGVQFGGENRDGTVVSCGTNCTRTIRGESKIALAHFSYIMRLQSQKGKFRPYVDGAVGASRTHWDGLTAGSGGFVGTSKNSWTYGFGTGVNLGKFRIGADYLNTAGNEGRRHNLLLHAGFVFSFGKR